MWITVYMRLRKKKERKTYENFKFLGESKGDQNNKVLENNPQPLSLDAYWIYIYIYIYI